jgi:hypothetical protein
LSHFGASCREFTYHFFTRGVPPFIVAIGESGLTKTMFLLRNNPVVQITTFITAQVTTAAYVAGFYDDRTPWEKAVAIVTEHRTRVVDWGVSNMAAARDYLGDINAQYEHFSGDVAASFREVYTDTVQTTRDVVITSREVALKNLENMRATTIKQIEEFCVVAAGTYTNNFRSLGRFVGRHYGAIATHLHSNKCTYALNAGVLCSAIYYYYSRTDSVAETWQHLFDTRTLGERAPNVVAPGPHPAGAPARTVPGRILPFQASPLIQESVATRYSRPVKVITVIDTVRDYIAVLVHNLTQEVVFTDQGQRRWWEHLYSTPDFVIKLAQFVILILYNGIGYIPGHSTFDRKYRMWKLEILSRNEYEQTLLTHANIIAVLRSDVLAKLGAESVRVRSANVRAVISRAIEDSMNDKQHGLDMETRQMVRTAAASAVLMETPFERIGRNMVDMDVVRNY